MFMGNTRHVTPKEENTVTQDVSKEDTKLISKKAGNVNPIKLHVKKR